MEKEIFDLGLLNEAFKKAREIHMSRGFQKRVGYGKRPGIITVDLANAWTRPGHTFSCDNMEEVLPAVLSVLDAARAKNVPIFHSTTAYNPNGYSDIGRWADKIPLETLKMGEDWIDIDTRLNPQPEETVFVKKMASCFNGTPLQYWLTTHGIDTLIVMGATAGACVRHTCMDSTELGFRTIVPEGTIADRIPGAVEWNLFDIDAKFGDVEPLETVINYFSTIEAFEKRESESTVL
ncbi:isochorismatase family protein [Mesobacillus maritimus]|uniref:isochorismatase family protein n=1 Tax=Mesobacillus maritimus TaxID=1643336 RepID=UPI00384FA434